MQKPQIPIFMEITDAEWDEMVRLLCLREKKFKKNTIIFHQGDITEEMGIVMKGNVNIESVDVSGNARKCGSRGCICGDVCTLWRGNGGRCSGYERDSNSVSSYETAYA